jgi:uncharacterized membrane protein YbhN (UPF0104 family)
MSFPLVGNPSPEILRTSRSDKKHYHTYVLLSNSCVLAHGIISIMKNIVNLLGRILVVLSIILLVIKIVHHYHELPKFTWGLSAFLSLLGFVLACVVIGVISSYVWSILLRGGGVFLKLRQAYVITGQTQIAKYLPGNVFHYVGRFALARRQGISAEAVVLSTGVETFLVIATSALIVIAGLFFSGGVPVWIKETLGATSLPFLLAFTVIIAAIAVAAAFFLPNVRSWVLSRLAYLHSGRISKAMFLYVMVFVVFGISISFLPAALWGMNTELTWYQFTWGFTLAWVLGFVTPGAPGGIGIRELVFVGLYGKELGEGLAVGLAVVLRVITSLGDLATFGLAYWLGRRDDTVGRK